MKTKTSFKETIKKNGDRVAIVAENDQIYTYHDIDRISQEISLKVERRSLVFNFCTNEIDCVLGYFSFILYDHVTLMVGDKQDHNLKKKLIYRYSPDYLWLPSEGANLYPEFKRVFVCGKYALMKSKVEHANNFNKDLALLLPTSGTTGSPKYAKITAKNLEENAFSIAKALRIKKTDRAIASLPIYYSFGLSVINSNFLAGASILLTKSSLLTRLFWDLVGKHNPTSISGTPYHFEILDRLGLQSLEETSINTILHAGGRMKISLLKKLSSFCKSNNIKMYSMYGQTEATARMSYLPPSLLEQKLGSIGIAIPNGRFKLLDECGAIISTPGIKGNLIYEGDNVSQGYAHERVDLDKNDENKGNLDTGDIAFMDNDGFFYIVGRKKRFVKVYGNRINLDDIEDMLFAKFGECACIGDDDLIRIFTTKSVHLEEIKSFIFEKIFIKKRNIETNFINELPRSMNGKISYKELGA